MRDELILKGGCDALTLTNVFYRNINFIRLDTTLHGKEQNRLVNEGNGKASIRLLLLSASLPPFLSLQSSCQVNINDFCTAQINARSLLFCCQVAVWCLFKVVQI